MPSDCFLNGAPWTYQGECVVGSAGVVGLVVARALALAALKGRRLKRSPAAAAFRRKKAVL